MGRHCAKCEVNWTILSAPLSYPPNPFPVQFQLPQKICLIIFYVVLPLLVSRTLFRGTSVTQISLSYRPAIHIESNTIFSYRTLSHSYHRNFLHESICFSFESNWLDITNLASFYVRNCRLWTSPTTLAPEGANIFICRQCNYQNQQAFHVTLHQLVSLNACKWKLGLPRKLVCSYSLKVYRSLRSILLYGYKKRQRLSVC